ncbi:MarR family winged helix-turn-helix transcriptional regulator [Celeribacter indicus]|uniref:MarR family transcriptional regulator n=1 Tax=Celeribacter indicus TaxID=1208324 RepID=A0A0B5DXU2_9RHOB|nr:MarR family transcriptional regulator [Celeribacter indicus]AJE45052.1 MarR family transcriptional regulator [Celeribacter indicus]SDX42177.1 transcriptional regulator, MarR family [Celeribacter indicus]
MRKENPEGSGAQGADEDYDEIVLESFLTYKISILAKLIDRRTIRVMAQEFDLKLSEMRVLAQLANHSPGTVRYLARRMHMDRADVSRATSALIEKKYILRKVDKSDGRSALFQVTPKGLEHYRKILPTRVAENARISSILTEEENTVLRRAIAKLTAELTAEAEVLDQKP